MALNKGVYGLVGYPLGHSFSQEIHKLFNLIDYQLFSLTKDEFITFLEKREFSGINITIPYKELALKYCDELSETAHAVGSINTIINHDGILYGDNTDVLGLKTLLNYYNVDLKDKDVLILGTGGTSKTAAFLAKNLQAKSINFVSRRIHSEALSYSQLKNHQADILINTTPVGMAPNLKETPVDLKDLINLEAVIDVIYNPLKTKLILDSAKLNLRAYNGLLMLVAQAYYATKLFLNQALNQELILTTYYHLLRKKTNLVLIGMPGSGKSTIAKQLKLDKRIVDIDLLIEEKAQLSIPEIFEIYGEAYFRDLESKVIYEISQKQNLIIATGGGVILNPVNVELLRQNGLIFYLKKDLKNLIFTYQRPLVKNDQNLKDLYLKRQKLYLKAADEVIEAKSVEKTLKLIKEKWDAYFSN